MNIASRIITYS